MFDLKVVRDRAAIVSQVGLGPGVASQGGQLCFIHILSDQKALAALSVGGGSGEKQHGGDSSQQTDRDRHFRTHGNPFWAGKFLESKPLGANNGPKLRLRLHRVWNALYTTKNGDSVTFLSEIHHSCLETGYLN